MDVAKLSLFNHAVIDLTAELHHVEQHLVVGPAGEEDLAGIELIERAANRPDV